MRDSWSADAADATALFNEEGTPKYLSAMEKQLFLASADSFPPKVATFLLVLAYSGGRVSEVLGLTSASFDLHGGFVVMRTLKHRSRRLRQVPLPPKLLARIDQQFGLQERQASAHLQSLRLWSWCRQTAWRIVRRAMTVAGVRGKRACPKTLRHSYAVHALLEADVPITLLQRWLGHSRIATTAIYTHVVGREEYRFAERMWREPETLPFPKNGPSRQKTLTI